MACHPQRSTQTIIVRSPCRGVNLPEDAKTEMRFLTTDEVNDPADARREVSCCGVDRRLRTGRSILWCYAERHAASR